MEIGITIRHTAWRTALPEARRVTRKAALAALALASEPPANELAIVLADDALVRALNKDYRGIDKATNVLAFRYADGETAPAPGEALGDVVVALETARREAETAGRSLHEHLSHLVIHGVLHLLGYDHANDPDAETMENLEIQALAGIGITNPYMPAGAMTKK
ncbi:MAG: rRNA maturation RNase YbeY [Rhodospirillaceae bacterium]|jgi:probable rRNA maturation factor|nr:rRNA maturation RNase YbeY [Rhodospirillaceae bacterium]MBT6828897.1 rRNA maturation RNase YbeY [Rhodospirillaceae bacterium]